MTIQELKEKIDEEVGLHELGNWIEEECCEGIPTKHDTLFPRKDKLILAGMPFKLIVSGERDYSSYFYIFSIGDKTYQWVGRYDSWAGTEMDSFDEFFEVKHAKKTIGFWEAVKE